jgi:formate dehydrogenase
MVDVTYDPDRILYPMKRTGEPGEFTRITWEQAFNEICTSLKNTKSNFGKEAVAFYRGNPAVFSSANALVMDSFCKALGIKWRYDVDAEDGKAVKAALILMYGSMGALTVPDLWHTDYVLIIGANPLVSHGSSISEPRVAMALKDIRTRGGQIVVIDPRRTETAKGNTHIPVQAGSDAYLISALIYEVIEQGWVDNNFVESHTSGYEALEQAVTGCTPEWAETHSGIPASTIGEIARDFATNKRACIH